MFPHFGLLPKEIRLQIWTSALKPRVIPLHRSTDRTQWRGSYFPTKRMPAVYMALNTNDVSYGLIRRACPEAELLCRKRYIDWQVWDLRKNHLGTPYSPHSDIIYFSGTINATVLLEFASRFPEETCRMKDIALPGVLVPATDESREDVLAALRAFEGLRRLIIVMANGESCREPHMLWDGEGHLVRSRETWTLPTSVVDTFHQLKRDRWHDWKIPQVIIVPSQESIQGQLSTD